MKKQVLYLVLVILGFSACKKDSKNNPPPVPPVKSTKLYAITFNLANTFAPIAGTKAPHLSTGRFNSRAAEEPLAGNLGVLDYIVYNSVGSPVHQITEDSTMSYFGMITDSLPAGNYTIVMAAGHSALAYGNGYISSLSTDYLIFGQQDFFATKFPLTVTSAAINQTITLPRRIGALEVKILDTIPANASKFVVQFTNASEYLIQKDTLGKLIPATITNIVPDTSLSKPNYLINTLVSDVDGPFSVTLTCYDASGTVIVQATISDVVCERNTLTILSGKLFNQGSSFTVGADGVWAPTTSTVKF